MSIMYDKDKKEIEEIFLELNKKIQLQIKEFKKLSEEIMETHKIFTDISYERILAFYSTIFLSKIFKDKNYKLEGFSSEFPILKETYKELNENQDKMDMIQREVGINKRWEKTMYVDSFFKIKKEDRPFYIFVEYKIEDRFEYMKLAQDYLKYKIYTCYEECNTIFIYIIFDRKRGFEIVNSNIKDSFEYLSREIKEKKLNKMPKIFIYIPEKCQNYLFEYPLTSPENPHQTIFGMEETIKIYKQIEVINELSNKFNESKIEGNIYFGSINKFGKNAKKIFFSYFNRINYENYQYLYEEVKKKIEESSIKEKDYEEYEKIFLGIEKSEEKIKELLSKNGKYFYNQRRNTVSDSRKIAESYGHITYQGVSIYIGALFEYFSSIYNIDFKINIPDHKDKNRAIIENVKIKLKEYYEERNVKNNEELNSLFLTLLFFIKNIFDFSLTKKENIYEIKEEIINDKVEQNINKKIKKLMKEIGLKDEIKVSDKNFKEKTLNILLNKILEKTN